MKLGRNRYNDVSATEGVLVMLMLLAVFAVSITAAYGWIMNIVALAHATAFSGMVVVRAIGVFIPVIGAVLGYV